MKLLLLSLLLLSGCSEIVYDNSGFGYDYKFETDSGIRFQTDGTDYLTPENIEENYRLVSECLGMTADPYDLMIIHKDSVSEFVENHGAVMITSEGPLLLLKPNGYDEPYNSYYLNITMRHEFIHYILLKVTGDGDKEHSTVNFSSCMYF